MKGIVTSDTRVRSACFEDCMSPWIGLFGIYTTQKIKPLTLFTKSPNESMTISTV